jgi:catechol 2,3-dioxygenase-like lactoylglutathione lyase family enzyme
VLKRVSHVNVWVHDQDEALAFFTEKRDEDTAEQLTALVARGAVSGGGSVIFASDDVQATYEDLSARGVEFTQPPMERSYGIDAAFRDPSGNAYRITQRSG